MTREVVRCEETRKEARERLRVRLERDAGKEGEGEEKASKQRGEVVVLRSVRMSAFPLSGEGGTIGALCLSLHSFMPRSEGEVKGA